jgi:3-oxoadipate enol-lactonase
MQADIGGITLHYETYGEAGPWVTLSHSLAASTRMWRPQIEALGGAFRVLAFDTRGHGESEATTPPYAMETLAGDLLALLDHLGIARTHLVGLSLGGALAQTFALAHPGRVDRLVIADATSAYPPATHVMWQQRVNAVASGGMAAVAAGTLGRWFTEAWRAANPEKLSLVEAMVLATPPEGFIGAVHALMGFDASARLGTIAAPTLVMVGAEDQALPPAHSEKIATLIPGARLVVIPDAAHISNLEQPSRFNAALLGFLNAT